MKSTPGLNNSPEKRAFIQGANNWADIFPGNYKCEDSSWLNSFPTLTTRTFEGWFQQDGP